MKMTFGKYKGVGIRNVPKDYLEWVVRECKNIAPDLRRDIELVLRLYAAGENKPVKTASKPVTAALPPTPATKADIEGILLADSIVRDKFEFYHADAVFTDGGVAGRNPSTVGGSWAWRAIDSKGGVVESHSGVLVPCPDVRELQKITNNHTELYAAIDVLARLPDGWAGKIVSDSSCTIKRLQSRKATMTNTPQIWVERMKAHLARLGKLSFHLVAGHPTPYDLQRGFDMNGVPVSEHNVAVDEECTRLAGELLKKK